MNILPGLFFFLTLELGLGCEPEYTRSFRQGTIQRIIRQGRQLSNVEPACQLRDPRRFLQALVVSQLLQPIGTGQARQGRRQKDKKKRGLRRRKGKDRRRKGSE